MLQHIREKAQGWIAFAIVAMLIIGLTTVVWDGFFRPDPDVPVARVNGEKISSNQFQRALAQERNLQQQRIAELQRVFSDIDVSQFLPEENELKQNVLRRLEEESLILQKAQDVGYRVSDALLAQRVQSYDIFQSNGQFDSDLYKQRLAQNGMSPGMFEDMLRRDVILQQYRMSLVSTSWSTEQERNALLKLQEQRRDMGFLIIPAKKYLEQVNVTDEQARSYYDSNAARFSTEEKVSIQYLELNIADLAKDVDIDEERLQEQYEDRQSDFGVAEERRTRQIMIEVAGDANEEALTTAQQKTESIRQQIADGTSFETLAREHSDDIGSANDGGDLGYMTHSMMMDLDPAFADAAFALAKGEVSEPVKSAYGFHLIKVDEIKAGQVKSFDEVRAQLEQEYRRHQAEDRFFEQGEVLANLTFENPDTLEIAAQELGLKIKTSPLFTRDIGADISTNKDVRSTAFSEEVLLEGNNSQPLELGDDRVVVIRVSEHQESAIRPFEEVQQRIIEKLRQEQAQAKAEDEGNEILALLAENADIESIAKERELEWSHPDPIKRNALEIDQAVVQKAFRIPAPDDNQPSFDGLTIDSGDFSVVGVFSIVDGDAAETAQESQVEQIKTQRERYYGTNELMGAMHDMRLTAEIQEYPENL